MSALPKDFEALGHIEDLSIAVTKLELERQGLSFANANVPLNDRIELGMRVAVNEAKLMKAKAELSQAQKRFAELP